MTGQARHWRPLAALLVGAVLMTACQNAGGEPQAPVGGATTESGTVAAKAAFDDLTDAMRKGDTAALRAMSTGPAASYFAHVDIGRRASGRPANDVFPHLRARAGEFTTDADTVTFTGPVTWGDPEGPPPRVLTDLVFVAREGGWVLDRFVRNGIPLTRWVVQADAEPVGEPPVTGRVVGVFVDVTCLESIDSGCPEELADGLAVDFEVTNDSDAPLEPGEVNLPDGSAAAAWLETPAGPQPLLTAVLQGFPPGETSPVSVVVGGVNSMKEGGVLHTALVTADGTTHPLDLQVPAYPATW